MKLYELPNIAQEAACEVMKTMLNKTLDKEDTLIELEAYLPDVYEKTEIGHILHILMYGETGNKSELDMPFFLFQEWPQLSPGPDAVQSRYAYTSGNLNEASVQFITTNVASIAGGSVEAISRVRRGEPGAKPQGISPVAIIDTNYRDFIS